MLMFEAQMEKVVKLQLWINGGKRNIGGLTFGIVLPGAYMPQSRRNKGQVLSEGQNKWSLEGSLEADTILRDATVEMGKEICIY